LAARRAFGIGATNAQPIQVDRAGRYVVAMPDGWNGSVSEKRLIAVVDDDESVRQGLGGLLRSLGYCTVAFPDAEQLLCSDRRNEISCLIADVQMPGLGGLELHRKLAASDKEPIPTILITAYPSDRIRRLSRDAGVICFLTKPFGEDELVACLRTALADRD
jgi:FixJ family two-component response regulator